MKKQNLKRTLALVAGSLVIALLVSILPGSYLANAAEVTNIDAKELAIEFVNDESAKITEINKDHLDDEDNPYYLITVKTDDGEFEVKVYTANGEIKSTPKEKPVPRDLKIFADLEKFIDFENLVTDKDFIDKKVYEDYIVNKPSIHSGLNQFLRYAKHLAIAEFKEAENKEDAKVVFKDANELIKETKTDVKEAIKVENEVKVIKEKPVVKKLVNKVKLNEKQALLIALKKIGINIDDEKLTALDKLTKTEEFAKLFCLDTLEIAKDDNQSTYLIKFAKHDFVYEIKINAISGAILDYERKYVKNDNVKLDKDDKDNQCNDDTKYNKDIKDTKYNKDTKYDKDTKHNKDAKYNKDSKDTECNNDNNAHRNK